MMKHYYCHGSRWLPCITFKQSESLLGITRQGIHYHMKINKFPQSFKYDDVVYFDLKKVTNWIATRKGGKHA